MNKPHSEENADPFAPEMVTVDITKKKTFKEWIIVALCFGIGGHVALGILLHAPDMWPKERFGLLGILSGMSVYVVVQVCRSLWWLVRGDRGLESTRDDE